MSKKSKARSVGKAYKSSSKAGKSDKITKGEYAVMVLALLLLLSSFVLSVMLSVKLVNYRDTLSKLYNIMIARMVINGIILFLFAYAMFKIHQNQKIGKEGVWIFVILILQIIGFIIVSSQDGYNRYLQLDDPNNPLKVLDDSVQAQLRTFLIIDIIFILVWFGVMVFGIFTSRTGFPVIWYM